MDGAETKIKNVFQNSINELETKLNKLKATKENKKRRVTCRKCLRKFNTLSELSVHSEKHKSKVIEISSKLNVRISSKYQKKTSNEFVGNTLKRSNQMKSHLKASAIETNHFKEPSSNETIEKKKSIFKQKPFECDECGKKFSHLGNFKVHKRIHTGEKPFQCDECEFKCITLGNLKVHKRIHTKEKPFKCDECEYKCITSGNLKVHKRIHTGERPYSCYQCDYKYTRLGSLMTHKKTHTVEKP